jgi:enamine deaminase RidA (YjgF/YER057c/UK114 family)
MSEGRFTRIPAPVVPGIADSVKVTAGDLLFVSGAVGFEADGSVPADFARATELTLREVQRALKAGGADFSSLVRVNVYIAGLDQEKLGIYRRVRDEIVGTDIVIASTLIGVEALFNSSTIEIDAIAAV